jgi:hypothetical protein
MATLDNLGFEVEEEGQLALEGDQAPGLLLLEGDQAPGNLLLEGDALPAGEAEDWTRDAIATAVEIAIFHVVAFESRFEDYEREWQTNEDFRFAFLVGDTFPALFDGALPLPEGVEDYEEGWQSNEGFLFSLSALEAALFDSGTPEAVEDYEEEWQSNESWSDVLGATTLAIFNVSNPDTTEFYEEEWQSNELWSDVLGAIDKALFRSGADGQEEYEAIYVDLAATADAASDELTVPLHGLAAGEAVEFRNEGGRLPDGLTASYTYLALIVNANVIQVENVLGAGATDIVDGGIGTHFLLGSTALYWRVPPP